MKTNFILMLLTIASFDLKAQTTYPSGATGCIARWTFDTTDQTMLTNLPDKSGNNNHGTTYDIASVSGFRNKPNSAGGFNGTSSWAEVQHNNGLNPTNITIVCLIKFNSFYSGLCQGNNIIHKGFNYNADLSWAMAVSENDNNCNLSNPNIEKTYFFTPNLPNYIPPTTDFIDSAQWYLLICRFNGTTISYFQIKMDTSNYINGVLPSYVNSNITPLGNSLENIYIGATQNPPFKFWLNGSIDEMVVFNKSLSDIEIQGVYDFLWGYIPTSSSNLVEYENQFIQKGNELLWENIIVKRVEFLNAYGQIISVSLNPKNRVLLPEQKNQLIITRIYSTDNKIFTMKINTL